MHEVVGLIKNKSVHMTIASVAIVIYFVSELVNGSVKPLLPIHIIAFSIIFPFLYLVLLCPIRKNFGKEIYKQNKSSDRYAIIFWLGTLIIAGLIIFNIVLAKIPAKEYVASQEFALKAVLLSPFDGLLEGKRKSHRSTAYRYNIYLSIESNYVVCSAKSKLGSTNVIEILQSNPVKLNIYSNFLGVKLIKTNDCEQVLEKTISD